MSFANIWCSSWNFQPPWNEADSVDLARQRQIDHVFESLAGEPARFLRDFAARDARGVGVAEIEQRYGFRWPAHVHDAGKDPVADFHPRIAHAELEHAPIAHHDDAGRLLGLSRSKQPGGDLGPDAGHVSEHQADYWFVHHA